MALCSLPHVVLSIPAPLFSLSLFLGRCALSPLIGDPLQPGISKAWTHALQMSNILMALRRPTTISRNQGAGKPKQDVAGKGFALQSELRTSCAQFYDRDRVSRPINTARKQVG